MGKKYILGNWKMHGTQAEARVLAATILKQETQAQVVLFPPTPLLHLVGETLKGSPTAWGAQDVSPEANGAFTGDVSAAMLKDAGCGYVIVGHSERRGRHGESNALVRAKAMAAMQAGLIPVICVGESLEERESGRHIDVIRSQVENSLPKAQETPFLVAYEPVWAIGSGKTPSALQISEAHKTIASMPSYATSGAALGVAYGGSVKAENARDILKTPGVSGVLVGGASLKADEFVAIIRCA